MPAHASVSGPASFITFGDLLKHLRLRAGLTQRELALAVGYNHAHLSRLEHNQRLPDTATLRALFIPALGLEREPEWAARLIELAAEGRGEPPPGSLSPGRAPHASGGIEAGRRAPLRRNLPAPLTPLLGRDVAIEAAQQMLRHRDVRLLTLLGPPGIGKTRLAVQVAADLTDQFADGVVFVDLTLLRDPNLLTETVAEALEIKEATGPPPAARLRAELHDRHVLIVLDNFEQVVAAAPLVVEWLGNAPRLKVLVTSREALRVSGENEFHVPPLSIPDVTHLPPAGREIVTALAPYTAVQLFVQRARAAQPDFELTSENAAAIAEICAHLDGLPLAIELAAARAKLFSPQAMLARLDRRWQWLTGGVRDGPAWRKTLRGAIDWSYDLLEKGEQQVFMQLAVFSGGFTADGAEVVCDPESDSGMTLERLAALADKSLIKAASPTTGDEPRFTMLETLREYALERLREYPAVRAAAQRTHAVYHLKLAEAADVALQGGQPTGWLNRLEVEHDNLRAALTWTLTSDLDLGLPLVNHLGTFWYRRGHLAEGRRWLEAAWALTTGPRTSPWRVTLGRQLGEAYWNLGEFAAARACLEESLSLARAESPRNPQVLMDTLNALGRVVKDLGDYAGAKRYLEEGLTLARDSASQEALIPLLRNLGNVNVDLGNFPEAKRCFEESLALARAQGDRFATAGALNNLGLVAITLKAYAEAQAYFQESQAIFEEDGNQLGVALTSVNLGRIAHAQGRFTDARKLYQTSLSLAREIGKKWSVAYALNNLGLVACDLGELPEAARCFREGLQAASEAGAIPRALDGLGGLAVLRAKEGQAEQAVELLGLVLHHPASEHEALERAQLLLAELKADLPDEVTTAALNRGRTREWESVARAELL